MSADGTKPGAIVVTPAEAQALGVLVAERIVTMIAQGFEWEGGVLRFSKPAPEAGEGRRLNAAVPIEVGK